MDIDERINSLPDIERDAMIDLKRLLSKRFINAKVNPKYIGMVTGQLKKTLSGDGRTAFYSWAFGRPINSSKLLLADEAFALVLWAQPHKDDLGDGKWKFSARCISDLPILFKLFIGGVGQAELPMPVEAAPAKPKRSKEQIVKELGFDQWEDS